MTMTSRLLKELDSRATEIAETLDLAAYQRPMQPLPPRIEQAYARGVQVVPADAGLEPRDLLRPGGDGLDDGAYRLADGRMLVACRTDMAGVDPAMWDWWFGWHLVSSVRYRLWHPLEHREARIADVAPASAPLRARYVGKVSFVDEHIGPSPLQKLGIAFANPQEFGLDPARVDALGTAICARTWLREPGIAVGRLVHLVQRTNDGAEMLSRFWLGEFDAGDDVSDGVVAAAPVRRPPPDNAGLYLLRHCAGEMNHLAGFLPELHVRFGDS